jgi:methionine sulfoxide reductase heme-binding subunit
MIVGYFSATHVHLGSALAAAQTSPTMWYLTRATAVAAYILLTLSVVFGTLRSIARNTHESLSWTVDEIHQVSATLMVGMMLGHLITLNLDPFLPFTITNLLVPLNEPFNPQAVNIGVFAMYTIMLLALSSWLKRFIAYRAWRMIHYLSFVAFALVTLHGWLGGSDTGEPWMRAVYFGSAAAVIFLVLVRLVAGLAQSSPSTAK